MAVWILFACFFLNTVDTLENGLARTPPMGWMSWGYYKCGVDCDKEPEMCLNELLLLSVADAFYEEGYQEAGYEYIIIDDCWSEWRRDEMGRLVPNADRFPSGMKYIANYIHSKGLKFGMYTAVGNTTCMQYPGSRGHFQIDLATFAEWEVDYLKVDGCFVDQHYSNTAYIELGEHMSKSGRPMVYSCSWPYYVKYVHRGVPDYERVARHCNLWRDFHDVVASWAAVRAIADHYRDHYAAYHETHGPGHWHDPDMLVVGTQSLTEGQSRVQLAVYAMLSAPLLLSCDLAKLGASERRLLQNLDLVAIDQDPLGVMARPYTLDKELTLWVKPRLPRKGDSYLSYSFALVNAADTDNSVFFTPGDYGLNCTDGYAVMDVFTTVFIRNISLADRITALVPAEDVILYTMFPL